MVANYLNHCCLTLKFFKMKKISIEWITGISLFFISLSVFAQNASIENVSSISPYPLAVTDMKTTSLVFPFSIISVDIGSQSVLVQKAKGVENILFVKAANKGFDQTNMTVITSDGKLYPFLLDYAPNPDRLSLVFNASEQTKHLVLLPEGVPNQGELQFFARVALIQKQKLHGIKDKKSGIKISLYGLYVHNKTMYFRVKINNRSTIGYDIDQLRFFLCDQRKAKRTASQEIEIKPLYIQDETQCVSGQLQHVFVFAIPKYTIPDEKYLAIQLMERNGGRNLQLEIHNRVIMRSTALPPK